DLHQWSSHMSHTTTAVRAGWSLWSCVEGMPLKEVVFFTTAPPRTVTDSSATRIRLRASRLSSFLLESAGARAVATSTMMIVTRFMTVLQTCSRDHTGRRIAPKDEKTPGECRGSGLAQD